MRLAHPSGLLPPPTAPVAGVIENGIHVSAYRFGREKQAFVLALGRICPEKGFHLALDAGARAGVPVLLAGVTFGYAAHERYFRYEILPRLDAERRFVGAVQGETKRRLLANARCLVVPSLVDETSSPVTMEALASGTPVVAFRRGALVELIEDGRTGFLVDGWEEMAEAISEVGRLRPDAARASAMRRFDMGRTFRAYLEMYQRLATHARLGAPCEPDRIAPMVPAPFGRETAELTVERVESRAELEQRRPQWSALAARCPWATAFQTPLKPKSSPPHAATTAEAMSSPGQHGIASIG